MGSAFKKISPREFMTRIVGKFLCSLVNDRDQRTSFSYFSPFYGKHMVNVMKWFVKKVSTHSQSAHSGVL